MELLQGRRKRSRLGRVTKTGYQKGGLLARDIKSKWGPRTERNGRSGFARSFDYLAKQVRRRIMRTAIQRVVDAAATVLMPAMDMFWGDRYGVVKDP